ncbi:MAG: hypothetical protein IJD95_00265 [Clostridia bacterium]|nr:hypothetical protein [Clostridia bacterium]
MKLIKTLKSKRGVAIENAVIFMLLIFLFCELLLGLALVAHKQLKVDSLLLLNEVKIEQVGEDYLASIKAKTEFTQIYEDYAYEVNGKTLRVWNNSDETKTVILYVEAELDYSDQLKITSWRYSA